MASQLIHVIRHAHAGDRDAWSLDDDLRPLSERGCRQAQALVTQLREAPRAIHSSPSLRCLGTVLPLAMAHRLPVTTLDSLYEGGSAAAMLDQLGGLGQSPVVACTHGDVIAGLLAMLTAAGVTLSSLQAAKAGTWTVELRDGRLSSARYAPPP